jgi:hypothetical protein
MREPDLKRKLSRIAGRGFELPEDEGAFPIIDEHLTCLGSLDPEIRDSLFYEAVDTWISKGLLGREQLGRLTTRLISDEFLFKSIGEPAGNEVFLRTFSVLILDSIVKFSNASKNADPALLASIAAGMERYGLEERDLRGYVAPFGWAHAVAHGADVLASLMASPELDGWDARILASTREWLCKSPNVYTHQEDKRLARVLVAHCRHHGNRRSMLLAWVEKLMQDCPTSFSNSEAYARRANLLYLLQAFFFYLHAQPEETEMASLIETDIRVLMRIAPMV